MNPTSTATADARTLDVPGAASLYYEVRGSGPVVVLVGAPMDADPSRRGRSALVRLHRAHDGPAGHPPQPGRRPRPRFDPGDARRRPRPAPDAPRRGPCRGVRLQRRRRQRARAGAGAPRAGAHRDRPRAAAGRVARRPRAAAVETDEIIDTHLAGDVVGAWRKFLALANIHLPEEVFQQMFAGERDAQPRRTLLPARAHAAPDHPLVARTSPPCARRPPASWSASARSRRPLCDRTSRALAAELGVEPRCSPGDHIGFADDPASTRRAVCVLLLRER